MFETGIGVPCEAELQVYSAAMATHTIETEGRSRGMPPWPVADSIYLPQQRARSSSIALNELVHLRTD